MIYDIWFESEIKLQVKCNLWYVTWKQNKITIRNIIYDKVQLFCEDHKNLRTLDHGFDICLVNVKTMRKIVKIFVAFSEKLNFIWFENEIECKIDIWRLPL